MSDRDGRTYFPIFSARGESVLLPQGVALGWHVRRLQRKQAAFSAGLLPPPKRSLLIIIRARKLVRQVIARPIAMARNCVASGSAAPSTGGRRTCHDQVMAGLRAEFSMLEPRLGQFSARVKGNFARHYALGTASRRSVGFGPCVGRCRRVSAASLSSSRRERSRSGVLSGRPTAASNWLSAQRFR